MDVRRAEAELAGARVQFYPVGAIGFDELLGDGLRAVGGAVVDDDDFPVEFTGVGESVWGVLGALPDLEAYCSVNMRWRSHVMMGRFLRSLKVGRRTEYLSPVDFFAELMLGSQMSGGSW